MISLIIVTLAAGNRLDTAIIVTTIKSPCCIEALLTDFRP